MDQEGGGFAAIAALPAALRRGAVDEAAISEAFRRIFRVRIKLGLLDPPTQVPWNALGNGSATVESAAHIALAREAAEKAIALYSNRHNVLPLSAQTVKRLAVIGPQAIRTTLLLGNYVQDPGPDAGIVSILDGLYQRLGVNVTRGCSPQRDTDFDQPGQTGVACSAVADCCAMCTETRGCVAWTYYEGLCYLKNSTSGRMKRRGRVSGLAGHRPAPGASPVSWAPGCADVACASDAGFSRAEDATKGADAAVVVLGLDQGQEREGHDRATMALPGKQAELLRTVRDALPAGSPLVAVLVHGGPVNLTRVLPVADAVVDAFYPGMQGGTALARVLFGDVSPAGRAPVTVYQSEAQLPTRGSMSPYADPAAGEPGVTYRFMGGQPTVPFGFGLSYSNFTYGALELNATRLHPCSSLAVAVIVKNTGPRDADEVVQLYVQQPGTTVPVPQLRLADFARVKVPRGDSARVSLFLAPEYHTEVRETIDPYTPEVWVAEGPIELSVGGGQPGHAAVVRGTVNVTASATLSSCGQL